MARRIEILEIEYKYPTDMTRKDGTMGSTSLTQGELDTLRGYKQEIPTRNVKDIKYEEIPVVVLTPKK